MPSKSKGPGASAWLAAIIDGSDDAIVSKTLDGVITSWNRAAESMFGFSELEAIGQSITIIIPNDRLPEEAAIIANIRRGHRIEHFETTRQRKDTTPVDVSVTISPVRDEDGVICGASKILRDISDRKQAEERQDLLLGEMNHRVKNLFAVIAGLITLSVRGTDSKADFAATLNQRIFALARSHALTLPHPGQTTPAHNAITLTALLHAILEPYPGQCTIALHGNDMPVGSASLSALALMLHEFATNAAKYGALSSAAGRLTVDISSVDDALRLVWTERGGPVPDPAKAIDGFGTKLEQASLRSFDGTLERHWRPDGLVIVLTIPTLQIA